MRQMAVQNAYSVQTSVGAVTATYPLVIEAESGVIAVQFTLSGGQGYLPVSVSGLARHNGWEVERNNQGVWEPLDQDVHGNDYWQSLYEPTSDTYTITWNIQNEGSVEYRLVWTE